MIGSVQFDDWMRSLCLVRFANVTPLSMLTDNSMGQCVSHFSLHHWKTPGFAPFHIAPLRDLALACTRLFLTMLRNTWGHLAA